MLDRQKQKKSPPRSIFLINDMIQRGPHGAEEGNHARANLMGVIPGFIDYATSIESLRVFADQHYFRSAENKSDMMERFDRSLKNETFLHLLAKAKDEFEQNKLHLGKAESTLREAFLIFSQVEQGQEYHSVAILETAET